MLDKGYIVISTLLAHEPRDHLFELAAYVFNSDVTSEEDTVALKEAVQKIIGGKLEVLINNASVYPTVIQA